MEIGNPNVVWSASEDGTLRQHDFRECSSCPRAGSANQECRNVLVSILYYYYFLVGFLVSVVLIWFSLLQWSMLFDSYVQLLQFSLGHFFCFRSLKAKCGGKFYLRSILLFDFKCSSV